MKKHKYEEFKPIGKLTRIPDFLPPPHMLIFPKEETIKITLELTKGSVDFFKGEAKKNKTKYQAMIRKVIDIYAQQSRALDKK